MESSCLFAQLSRELPFQLLLMGCCIRQVARLRGIPCLIVAGFGASLAWLWQYQGLPLPDYGKISVGLAGGVRKGETDP